MNGRTENDAQGIIDVDDDRELIAWSSSLGVTADQLKRAVTQVGRSSDKVTLFLQRYESVQTDAARHAEPHA